MTVDHVPINILVTVCQVATFDIYPFHYLDLFVFTEFFPLLFAFCNNEDYTIQQSEEFSIG